MIIKETLIVLTDYASLAEKYADPNTRKRWGVIASPVLNNGKYILPLGWEDELDKAGISYEVMEVDFYVEDL